MVRIASPLDEVFEGIAAEARVEDAFDFVFFVVIDSDGRRWERAGRDAVSNGGWGSVRAEETDVEDRMDRQ
jgi:hypothetical protein